MNVLVAHQPGQKVVHRPVNACLAPVCSVAGVAGSGTNALFSSLVEEKKIAYSQVTEMAVTTVEGIGSTKTRMHPVQVRVCVCIRACAYTSVRMRPCVCPCVCVRVCVRACVCVCL